MVGKNSKRTLYRIYALAVFLGGLAVLGVLSRSLSPIDWLSETTATMVLWVTMVTIAGMSPIPLPRGGGSLRLTTALDIGAILVFGPALACWVGLSSRLVTNFTEGWNPFLPGVARLGQCLLSIAGAGYVYTLLGGELGLGLALETSQIVPVLGAAGTYIGIKQLLAFLEALFQEAHGSLAQWFRHFWVAAPFEIVMLPFGFLIALTQVQIGVVGVALFLIPLLLSRYLSRLWPETRRGHMSTVRTLLDAVDAGDPFAWGHSYRISKMSLRLGKYLSMSNESLETLEYAAMLHDIGRTAIKRDILLRPGKLSDSEKSLVKAIPKIGHDLLKDHNFFHGAAEIIYCYHEQPDGNGYPRGLSANEIPLGSRIIMCISAFDAMTSDRPYRRGLSPDDAFEELLKHTGTQFFPEIVEALIHLYSNDLLFEEFETNVLPKYAIGLGNSRAIEAFLLKKGVAPPEPEDFQDSTGVQVPIIEFPAEAMIGNNIAVEAVTEIDREFVLDSESGARLTVSALSDVGCVRSNNEDSFGVFGAEDDDAGCLLILADGMGGAAAGEVASGLAVDTVQSQFVNQRKKRKPVDALLFAVQDANRVIHDRSAFDQKLGGMGTTCTAVSFVGRDVVWAHVGDSRAYLVQADSIGQLTNDHTLASELSELSKTVGAPTPAANNVLTRCLGNEDAVEVDGDARRMLLDGNSAIVLCSDGLSNMVEDNEIQEIVSEFTPNVACRELVDLARARGGPDNITVIVAKLEAD